MLSCLPVCKPLSRKINILYKTQLEKAERSPSVFLIQAKPAGRDRGYLTGRLISIFKLFVEPWKASSQNRFDPSGHCGRIDVSHLEQVSDS